MKILIACNYYTPYVSGLTEYARMLAEGLVERGHTVGVAAVRHERSLPPIEVIRGVTVHRAAVWASVGRAPISPGFARSVARLSKEADLVNVHLPMADGLWLAPMLAKRNVVSTYHCDVALGKGLQRVQAFGVDLASRSILDRSVAVACSTLDYANHSRVLSKMLDKCVEIPPVNKEPVVAEPRFRTGSPMIGFVGRIVEEKGIDHLLKALPLVRDRFPDARVAIAGDWQNLAGQSDMARIRPFLPNDDSVTFTGKLSEEDLWSFYRSLDLFVLPSVNSFEAFGMVQIEAMACGVPVVASDLPGVRQPVKATGMGLIAPVGDHRGLADSIIAVLTDPGSFRAEPQTIEALYGRDTVLEAYETLFERVHRSSSGVASDE